MKTRFGILGSLLVGTVFGCNSGAPNINNSLGDDCSREISAEIRETLDTRIDEADFFYLQSGGHDIERYVGLLDNSRGKCSELLYTCENVRGSGFCYRMASADNSELREEICLDYEEYVSEFYDKNVVEGAVEECRLGIPQFIY